MQGRRSAVGSLPDTLGFDHGSTPSDAGIDHQICWNNMQNSAQNRLSDYMSPSNTSITYLNSMSEEEQNLSEWNIGEPSSTDIQNQVSHNERKTEHGWSSSMNACAEVSPILEERRFEPANIFSLNSPSVNLSSSQILNGPLFPQSSSSDSIPQDLNISSGFVGPPTTYKSSSSQNMWVPSSSSSSDPFGGPSGSGGYLVEENDARPGCGLEGNRISCKRKALEGNVEQSSGSGSSNYFQRAEGSVWHGVPARRNASRSLCISSPSESTLGGGPLEHVNQGLGLGVGGVASDSPLPLSASASAESSRRNFRLRINASHQQESTPTHAVPHQSSRLLPLNNSLNLRSPPPGDNTSPHDQFVAVHVPALRRNLQSSRWNQSSISRPGSSNSGISGERDAAPIEEPTTRTIPRNISEHPMFVPQNPVNWGVNGGNISLGGNVASTSRTGSSSGVHPSPGPNWVPHRNPPHYPRRLAELVRRSLLSESGGLSSNISPPGSGTSASSQEMSLLSGDQGHQHLPHSRSAVLLDRQLDGAFGIPYSMRNLAPGSEGGRSRLVSEQIRNVLDIMRRGEGLRFEDVMILDQSVFFGMPDVHDRHRDMRLDVDNMSYEELLALEERIGNVNTGLSEETILNCLKRRKCVSTTTTTTDQLEVEPCCVCQEEYKSGEDLGMLECGHDFHTHCIKQWLMQKNLCPICKTTALVT